MNGVKGFRQQTGALGEAAAVRHLTSLGYTIVQRNYRCPWGEIDIVADTGSEMVFVEVRARTSDTFGTPEESITPAKAERMIRAAQAYLLEHGVKRGWRIDLVAIVLMQGRVQRLDH